MKVLISGMKKKKRYEPEICSAQIIEWVSLFKVKKKISIRIILQLIE
jgi:hypothetical protein